ncbi:hypothetical protein Ciccas_002304 [Cichlidogyrus casuarinus]|uniref:K Homology domain-containing protein n=1 Tax=Cichlidogyrus casuarinus TaxID=1844966 RepID=A0ABD2QHN0_9PLAT
MLIGRSGQNIAAFREKHKVELVFPDRFEIDPELANQIHVLGSKADVANAQQELLQQIKALEDEAEATLVVPQDLVRNVRQAHKKMQERTRLTVSRGGKKSSPDEAIPTDAQGDVEMKLAGPKAMLETTKQALTLLIDDLRTYSKESPREFPVYDKFHARILARMKNQLPDLESEYRVIIKVDLPAREQIDSMPNPSITNESDQTIKQLLDVITDETQTQIGTVSVYGRPEQIESLWQEAFLPYLPINKKFTMSKDLHRYLVILPDSPKRGPPRKKEVPKGDASTTTNKVTQLQNSHGVYVKLPPVNQQESDFIMLSGTPPQIHAAEVQLKEWIAQWETDRADRIARNYEEKIQVKESYVPFIMAHKFDHWKSQFDVIFRVERQETTNGHDTAPEPEQEKNKEENGKAEDATDEDEHMEPLYPADTHLLLLSSGMKEATLRGYKEKVAEVKKELEQVKKELDAQQLEILNIPQSVHSQLIGAKRAKQLRMQREYGVQVEFPDRNASGESAHIVAVLGPQDKIDAACQYIISTAQELIDRQENRAPVPVHRGGGVIQFNGLNGAVNNASGGKNRGGVVLVGAPWDKAQTATQNE